MSQFGSGGMPSQAPQGGQVTFFDPSKFQKGAADFPPIPASQQGETPASSSQNYSSNTGAQQTSSWSTWDSWNGESNPYLDTATSHGNYVSSSTGYEAPAYDTTSGQQGGNFQTSVANDMNYNQQWYDQSQWNQQTDPQHYQLNPNAQQWVPNQYDYSQGTDPTQYSEYNQYNQCWGGQENDLNGHEHTHAHHQQGESGSHIEQSANNYFMSDPRSNLAQSNVETSHESGTSTSATESSPRQETSDDLDASQSTTESESQSHSLGQYEEGSLDGFVQNEDFVQENETKVVQHSNQMHYHQENQYTIPQEGSSGDNKGHVIGQGVGTELEGQMQSVSLQDNVKSHNAQVNFHPVPQPEMSQSHATETHGAQFAMSQSQQEAPVYSPHQVAGTDTQRANVPQSSQSAPPASRENQEHQTPTFGDWEMVPSQKESTASHSRNASMDNNVHFFISSNNSSARVSPATSVKTGGDDHDKAAERKDGQNAATDQTRGNAPANAGPPPTNLIPPPKGGGMADNPFRKSPNTSMLSSTQLEVTKGNIEGSPVVLRSLSPIAPTDEVKSQRQREAERDTDSPDIITTHGADTPKSSGAKKASVPQSPILPRKESPFQPPSKATDYKGKPIRASHDLPGVNSYMQRQNSEEDKQGSHDKKGRKTPELQGDRKTGKRTPDLDHVDRRREGRKTPDWDNNGKKREGRRTPDWDRSDRRREGRKTPDWDAGERRQAGRRTPDWDARDRKGEGRRTPDWDRSERDSGPDGYDKDRYGRDRRDRDRLSGRPPVAPSESRAHRSRQSAFQNYTANRNKNNVSPATSLWDTPDNLPNVSNILLVPASNSNTNSSLSAKDSSTAPLELSPVASLITSLSEQIKTDEPSEKVKDKDQSKNRKDTMDKRDRDSRYDKDSTLDSSSRTGYSRDKDRDRLRSNRSYDNLRDRDRGYKDSRNNSRERNSLYGSRDSLDQDDSRERGRRGDSRERDRYRDRDSYYDRHR